MWKRIILIISLVSVGIMIPRTSLAARQPPVTNHHTQRQLKKIMKTDGINGIVMVSGRHNRPIIISNQVTKDSREVEKPNRLVPVASFQKLITGLCIQQLIDNKKLSLATSLGRYFPNMINSGQVTVQRLMTHTSGLQQSKSPLIHPLVTEQQQQAYALSNMRSTGKFSWHYKDLDFSVLAALINWTSKESYQKYVNRHLLIPNHLHQTLFYNEVKSAANITQPMRSSHMNWQQMMLLMSGEYGAGGMLSTPNDYWKLLTKVFLDNPRLLKEFIAQRTNGSESYYGGVYIAQSMVHANGYLGGYACTFFANYKTKQTLMVFSNNVSYKGLKMLSANLYHQYFGGHWQ